MKSLTNLLIGLIIVLDLEMVFPTQPVRTSLKQQNIFQYGGNETGLKVDMEIVLKHCQKHIRPKGSVFPQKCYS